MLQRPDGPPAEPSSAVAQLRRTEGFAPQAGERGNENMGRGTAPLA